MTTASVSSVKKTSCRVRARCSVVLETSFLKSPLIYREIFQGESDYVFVENDD